MLHFSFLYGMGNQVKAVMPSHTLRYSELILTDHTFLHLLKRDIIDRIYLASPCLFTTPGSKESKGNRWEWVFNSAVTWSPN